MSANAKHVSRRRVRCGVDERARSTSRRHTGNKHAAKRLEDAKCRRPKMSACRQAKRRINGASKGEHSNRLIVNSKFQPKVGMSIGRLKNDDCDCKRSPFVCFWRLQPPLACSIFACRRVQRHARIVDCSSANARAPPISRCKRTVIF